MTFRVRDAVVDDLSSIMLLFERRVEWLAAMGSNQWQNFRSWERLLTETISRHQTMVLVDDGGVVRGTITINYRGERNFWTEEERGAPDSLYLSKLATDLRCKGQGLGDLLLDWSMNRASQLGKSSLRLDTWRLADGLHRYYKDRDWTHIRTLDFEELRDSGVLFEKPVRFVPDLRLWIAPTSHRSDEPGPTGPVRCVKDTDGLRFRPLPAPVPSAAGRELDPTAELRIIRRDEVLTRDNVRECRVEDYFAIRATPGAR